MLMFAKKQLQMTGDLTHWMRISVFQGPILLTWLSFNLSIDKYDEITYPFLNVIGWPLGMDKK